MLDEGELDLAASILEHLVSQKYACFQWKFEVVKINRDAAAIDNSKNRMGEGLVAHNYIGQDMN